MDAFLPFAIKCFKRWSTTWKFSKLGSMKKRKTSGIWSCDSLRCWPFILTICCVILHWLKSIRKAKLTKWLIKQWVFWWVFNDGRCNFEESMKGLFLTNKNFEVFIIENGNIISFRKFLVGRKMWFLKF